MKKLQLMKLIPVFIIALSFTVLSACSNDKDEIDDITKYEIEDEIEDVTTKTLTDGDITALLFMLEEEKLARDTYIYMNDVWSLNQFANIQKSEQTHMNAIENLLKQNNIAYNILPAGEFADKNLQSLYNQFLIDGVISKINALKIGATIEDLDIVDLQVNMDASSNAALISVFKSLECGSRNHLRSFVSGLEKNGSTYTPQFLTQEAYNTIIAASGEQCK